MKRILGLMMVISVVCSQLFATQTRLGGLGIANWMVEEDDNLIFLNPSRIISYPKLVWGEFGTATGSSITPVVDANITVANQWGGVSAEFPLVSGAVAGLFLNRPYGGMLGSAGSSLGITAIPANSYGRAMTARTPDTKFDLFYAFPIGGIQIGTLINMSADYIKDDNSTNSTTVAAGDSTTADEISSSDINVVLGSKLEDIGFISDLDIALTLGFPSAKNTYKTTIYSATYGWINTNDWLFQTNPGLNAGLTLRAATPLKDNKLLTYINFTSNDISNTFTRKTDTNSNNSFDDSATDTNYKQERTQKQTKITAGVSYNAKTSKKTLVLVAANIENTLTTNKAVNFQQFTTVNGKNQQRDDETSATKLPINFALEHNLSSVIAARIGISQDIFQQTSAKTTTPAITLSGTTSTQTSVTEVKTISQNPAATTLSLGAGINIYKGLTIDAVVRQQVLFSGTYLVSGVPETLVSQISAVFQF